MVVLSAIITGSVWGLILSSLRDVGAYPVTMRQGLGRALVVLSGPVALIGLELVVLNGAASPSQAFCFQTYQITTCVSPMIVIISHGLVVALLLIAWIRTLLGNWRNE